MNWIKRIEVLALWGKYNVCWQLDNQVSIIAGGNGTGKSTMFRSLAQFLKTGHIEPEQEGLFDEMIVTFDNNLAASTRHGFKTSQYHNKIYANFLPFDAPANITHNEAFCNQLDNLLSHSGKHIIRNSSDIQFEFENGKQIPFERLSSGEKEILRLFAIAASASPGDVLILDEPELSLHFDWQKSLINTILELSKGSIQLIVSTHSPAIVMHGWMANISQIESLITCL